MQARHVTDWIPRPEIASAGRASAAANLIASNPAPHLIAMIAQLTQNWWTFLLRGVCALLAGVFILVWPGSLILFFAAFALADGILALVAALGGYEKDRRVAPTWWLVIMGVCGVIAGVCAFKYPLMGLEMLVLFIAFWTFVSGVFGLFGAFDLPGESGGRGWLVFNAVISIVFSVLVFVWPVSGMFAIAWLIGFYAIFSGFSLAGLAFRLRGGPGKPGTHTDGTAHLG